MLSNISMWIARQEKETISLVQLESFLCEKCTKAVHSTIGKCGNGSTGYDGGSAICCSSVNLLSFWHLTQWCTCAATALLIPGMKYPFILISLNMRVMMSDLFMIISNYHLGDVMILQNNHWMFLWSRRTCFFSFSPTLRIPFSSKKAFKWYSLLLDGSSLTKELNLFCI